MSTELTPILTRFWDDPRSWTLETYEQHDGYQGLRKALVAVVLLVGLQRPGLGVVPEPGEDRRQLGAHALTSPPAGVSSGSFAGLSVDEWRPGARPPLSPARAEVSARADVSAPSAARAWSPSGAAQPR